MAILRHLPRETDQRRLAFSDNECESSPRFLYDGYAVSLAKPEDVMQAEKF